MNSHSLITIFKNHIKRLLIDCYFYLLLNNHFNPIKMLLIGYYFYSHLGQLKSASSYHPSLIFLINSAIGGVNEEQKAVT